MLVNDHLEEVNLISADNAAKNSGVKILKAREVLQREKQREADLKK